MLKTITLSVECQSEEQALKVKEALEFQVTKFKANGIIKMKEKYEGDVTVRFAVNKTLGI